MTKSIGEFLGATFTRIAVDDDKSSVTFTTTDGRQFVMHHEQDCCETVTLDDVCGEWSDLLGVPITLAESITGGAELRPDHGADKAHYYEESFTWTFYKLGTHKGTVTMRWYGGSNGYYSEDVSIYELKPVKEGETV